MATNHHVTDQRAIAVDSVREKLNSMCGDNSGMLVSAACLFIGLVSAYDAYLTLIYAPSLVSLEQNPIGRHIMGLDNASYPALRDVAAFLGLKFAGTVTAISTIHIVFHFRARLAAIVALGLASFQAWLLAYLNCS